MDPYVVKAIEVVIMQLVVLGGIVAILVAAVWDIVQAKVQESRRRDRIAPKPVTHTWFAHHHLHNPFAHHHV